MPTFPIRVLALSVLLSAAPTRVPAGPWIAPGDPGVRHDLHLLSDAGIITAPLLSWPLSWASIVGDIEAAGSVAGLPAGEGAALRRVTERMRAETRSAGISRHVGLAAAEKPAAVRGFLDAPRGEAEAHGRLDWLGDRFAGRLAVQAVADDPTEDRDVRLDGSFVAAIVGNWMLSLGAVERWWGPGWDGSLILSTNARPIPAISLQRNFTAPPSPAWLRWVGPWSMSVVWGQLERDRFVPDARYFAWQLSFKPLPSLEIGLERSAQWCGSGRPCDAGTFFDLLAGNDNRGDAGIELGNEPGNQLAGIHGRWSSARGNWPLAVYFQLTGEDEAGGLPSKLLGLLGVEHWGGWGAGWTYRAHLETADTTCSFLDDPGEFDCAYNHSIYQTGYRYRGRSIGHAVEQDARSLSFGIVALSGTGVLWQGRILHAELNRGGAADLRNSLTPTPRDLTSVDVSHGRDTPWGRLLIGLAFDRMEDALLEDTQGDVRGFVRWQRVF